MTRSRFIAIYNPDHQLSLNVAKSFSPQVEKNRPGAILFPVSRRSQGQICNRILQIKVNKIPLKFGLASTGTTAILAALLKPGSRVSEKQTSQFIRFFEIEHLLSLYLFIPKVLKTLKRWGIHNIGQLADLPKSQLIDRMGKQGLHLHRISQGKDLIPFQPITEPIRFVITETLPWEIEDLQHLTFLFEKLLLQLCRKLETHGLLTDQLNIKLGMRGGKYYQKSIPLAFPMRNSKVLLSLLRLKIQSTKPESPIYRVELEARPLQSKIHQHSLLESNRIHPEQFSKTLSRLWKLTSESNMGVAVSINTHHPDRFKQVGFSVFKGKKKIGSWKGGSPAKLILRRLRPPRPIKINIRQILHCSGPWRSSGNWWETKSSPESLNHDKTGYWERDEWDIEMATGIICRIFWDKPTKQYFIEGVYD